MNVRLSRQPVFYLTLTALLVGAAPFFAQSTAPTTKSSTLPRGSAPVDYPAASSVARGPALSIGQQESFLATAPIQEQKKLAEGLTGSFKCTLSDGRTTHTAHFQPIDIYQPVFHGKNGTTEKNFRDTWKFNVAAYRLAKLLDLTDMVPVSVERQVDGVAGSMDWWVDNMQMTELQRRERKIPVPTTQVWINQLNTVRVFDQLISNTDRNQGNLLITNDWKVWMIDHTRAFRTQTTLLNPDALSRCDFKLLNKLKALKQETVAQELGGYLRPEEISGLMARRDVIVKLFADKVAEKGDVSVLTNLPRSTPQAQVP